MKHKLLNYARLVHTVIDNHPHLSKDTTEQVHQLLDALILGGHHLHHLPPEQWRGGTPQITTLPPANNADQLR